MKKSTQSQLLKVLASHALLVAIVTQPYILSVITDLSIFMKVAVDKGNLGFNLLSTLGVISAISFTLFIVFCIMYFVQKNKR